ncbi:MbtH family NRPS accessory protein (plasmid) [Tistrella mobilis]|jgi:MbtH protein|uniref:MbtH family protein n=1 Tax=Tistrella mobilis TaxID=171437 RepID=UPI003558C832
MSWGDETTVFDVVINHEEQYSIWPSYKPIPEGWRAVGKQGPKAECLAYIDEVWTDMRPLSLRRAMEARAAGDAGPSAP